MTPLLAILLFLVPTATASAVDRALEPPRRAFNAALAALERGDLEVAEKGLVDARDRADPADDELRYRSAYDLALAYAGQAEKLAKEKPEDALATLRSAVAWARDSVRRRPDDADARANLEVILRRVAALSDEVNRRAGSLEARLDRLTDDQRGLRDDVRGLVSRVASARASAEPLGFEEPFRADAAWQRVLLSEAGAIVELAGDDAGHLASKGKDQESDQDRLREAQLGSLAQHVDRARQRMADARSLLQKLDGGAAHRSADAALRELRRAREQLLDPVALLRALLGDEVALRADTAARAAPASPITMTPTSAGPPAWCTPEHLRERQDDARERLGELTQRLEAATGGGAQGGAQKDDRRTQRLVAAAKEALPHLADAAAAMQAASTALARDRANEAAAREDEAIESLATAAERFSGVRELIELAFAEQSTIALLLDPTATAEAMEAASRPPLDAPERARLVGAGVTRNQERLERLAGLFEEEVAALGEAKAPDPKAPSAPDERDRYREAEKERRAAADATGRLALSLKLKDAEEPLLPIAREARDHIEAMRRLFFTIVEHLEELARRQAETRDATATAAGESEAAKRKEAAAPPRTQEERHAATAKAIARALGDEAKQATATADVGAKLAQAADEVGEAARGMDSATNELALAAPDLEAALGHEKDALERLAAAIALLKPPDRGGGSQDQAQPKPSESSVSRDQAQRRLEGVREREADRLRGDRKRREATAPEPVEKDW